MEYSICNLKKKIIEIQEKYIHYEGLVSKYGHSNDYRYQSLQYVVIHQLYRLLFTKAANIKS